MSSTDYLGTLGLELVEWEESRAVVSLTIGSHLLNRSGFVHGGVILSMLDVACARAGCYSEHDAPPRFATTLSMSTNFLRATRSGMIRAIGRRLPGGRTIFTCKGEVLDGEDNVLAIGQAVFRYRTKSAAAALQGLSAAVVEEAESR